MTKTWETSANTELLIDSQTKEILAVVKFKEYGWRVTQYNQHIADYLDLSSAKEAALNLPKAAKVQNIIKQIIPLIDG